jgi:hypothetical protein
MQSKDKIKKTSTNIQKTNILTFSLLSVIFGKKTALFDKCGFT